MKTRTFLAGAMALAIGVTLSAIGPAQAQQLGTGSDVLGRSGAALGEGAVATDEAATRKDQQAVAPAAFGDCVTNRTAFRTQGNVVSTTSFDFVTMPNTHFPVTTSGGCLIVDFSGEVAISTTDTSMHIRAFIAGIGVAEPSEVFLGLPVVANLPEMKSMRFVFPNVPAGQHVVRIEFASSAGGRVNTSNRTLTVQYRP